MTDESRGVEAVGPPWSVDLLADLHAGVLDDAQAEQLWPLVHEDPEARAIIEALEATTAELSALGSAPAPPMPAEFAARIDAALAEEARQAFAAAPAAAPVVDLDLARRRRNRRTGWITGVVAVAAAAVAAVAIMVPKSTSTTGNPIAAPPADQGSGAPLALRSDRPEAAIGQLNGVKDYGQLGTSARLSTCLEAAGFASTADPIGVRPGTVDGQPAVLVLLTTGKLAEFRLVALSPSCGPSPLLDKVVGK